MSVPSINWRNANHDESAFEIYDAGAFAGCLVLSTLGPAVVWQIRARYPNALIIARLFRGGPDLPSVTDAAAEWRNYIFDTQTRVDLYQVDNEPDMNYPNVSPEDFCIWWVAVVTKLRAKFPGITVGFPMPSIRGEAAWDYIKPCRTGIEAADWIAERAYWQVPWEMESQVWGKRYEVTRNIFGQKPIHLTEYGCSDPSLSGAERVRQYRDFQRGLPAYVTSHHVFIQAGGSADWKLLGFEVDADMARAMRVEEEPMSVEFQVGPGILDAMAVRGESPVEDETYIGEGFSYCASKEALYQWDRAANRITRTPFLA